MQLASAPHCRDPRVHIDDRRLRPHRMESSKVSSAVDFVHPGSSSARVLAPLC